MTLWEQVQDLAGRIRILEERMKNAEAHLKPQEEEEEEEEEGGAHVTMYKMPDGSVVLVGRHQAETGEGSA